ncbi:MAG: hypothetical protein M0011_03945 [Elusimicrobia bacterium]|nr:hypothetical protein [Elusimicrobiota bacterium]
MKLCKYLPLAALCLLPTAVSATPSTQIWIPSTDVQKYKSVHLNVDNYISSSKESAGTWKAPVFMIGPTMGIFEGAKLKAEAGFDIMRAGAAADSSPIYLNAKIGAPAGAYFANSPAFAAGIYNLGTNQDTTAQNVVYALGAKALPGVGRLSAGYYVGNSAVLVDEKGKSANNGVLLSLDRAMTEVSDKLWAAIDYQSGRSSLGALSLGASWAFTPSTSILFGYDFYNNTKVTGKNTFTVQVDINLW